MRVYMFPELNVASFGIFVEGIRTDTCVLMSFIYIYIYIFIYLFIYLWSSL
jgi:hypothetical protein